MSHEVSMFLTAGSEIVKIEIAWWKMLQFTWRSFKISGFSDSTLLEQFGAHVPF